MQKIVLSINNKVETLYPSNWKEVDPYKEGGEGATSPPLLNEHPRKETTMLIKQNPRSNPVRGRVNKITAAILCAGLSFAALPAFAAPVNMATGVNAVTATVTETVRIDRADLETNRGIARVYAKLQQKADRSCRNQGVTPRQSASLKQACIKDLVNDFVASADDNRLADYHQAMSLKSS